MPGTLETLCKAKLPTSNGFSGCGYQCLPTFVQNLKKIYTLTDVQVNKDLSNMTLL